jgi:hypothetical protein
LRTLLLKTPAPTSFEFLQTINGATYKTYKEVAILLGLLDDDSECNASEVVTNINKLRELFVKLIIYNNNPMYTIKSSTTVGKSQSTM